MTDDELIRTRLAELVLAADQFSVAAWCGAAVTVNYYADRDVLTAAIEDARDALRGTS